MYTNCVSSHCILYNYSIYIYMGMFNVHATARDSSLDSLDACVSLLNCSPSPMPEYPTHTMPTCVPIPSDWNTIDVHDALSHLTGVDIICRLLKRTHRPEIRILVNIGNALDRRSIYIILLMRLLMLRLPIKYNIVKSNQQGTHSQPSENLINSHGSTGM